MDKEILKQIVILSALFGGVLGILTTIPFVGQIAFFVLMCLVSAAVIVFMSKLGFLELSDVKESVILGSVIGFISFMGFCISYMPLTVILAKVFHLYSNYGVVMMISNASLGMLLILAVFMGVLCATVNAFTGFVTYYITEFIKSTKK